jgi:hypothetical protein
MRFVFGQGWVHLFDETNGDDPNGTTGGATGGDGDATGGADDTTDKTAGGDDTDITTQTGAKDETNSMLKAITEGLAKTAPKVDLEEDPAKKAADAAAAAAKTEKHANGAPKKDAAGNDLDDKGVITKKAEAPKAKTAAELDLKPDEKKALGQKAQARFSEVITTLKAKEAEVTALTEKMKPLEEARQSIMGVLEETNTTSEQLSAYLEFNMLVQSQKPADLQKALDIVEEQRAALYVALGKEPGDGGIDLLQPFPDLAAKVADGQITREDALEIAQGRRDKAARDEQAQRGERQQQSAKQVQQSRDNALASIEGWVKSLASSDIDYKAKEAKVIDQVDKVIQDYPPEQWLPTLKLLYQGITITKAAPQKRSETPLRPTFAKPGAKAPGSMEEAIDVGLGYAK